MKSILIVLSLIIVNFSSGQTKGFEFLSASKSSLESIIKEYANSIPDTSETFKKFYLPLAKNYNKAKASYNGYRGAMKDCILNNETKSKIQKCLQSKSISIQSQLDTLNNILETAYLDASSKKIIKTTNPDYNGKNASLFTGDTIKAILDTLLNGAFKLFDDIKKYRKDYKDSYLNQITSKDYDLADIDDLLSKKTTSAAK
jgi:hypothetical protein